MHPLTVPGVSATGVATSHTWTVARGSAEGSSYAIERLNCESGFSVVRSSVLSERTLTEACSHDGVERQLIVAIALDGDSEFRDRRGERLPFSAGHTTVSVFRSGGGERRHGANRLVRQLRLVVSESTLTNFVGETRSRELLGPAPGHFEGFRQLAFTANSGSPHLRFFCSPDLLQQDGLSLRIHALSLLADQLRMIAPEPARCGRLGARDLDRLAHVEAFMRAHLDKPLNNAYLSATLGISEYKLKECFRQAYGTSPARYLLELRMYRAQELLEAGHQVAETAYRVGYQHPSNLSAAFTRFFGRTPKSVLGNRSPRANISVSESNRT
ncbi:AraC family transcriptional regulator [Burkholderia multivorans]|nr:AraC family transcriptional regulator [Burkholderia multivorans]MBU9515249.1 AraC family transcriptional regulator [Burkholderia multivorans]MBU9527527.1 AraC family transcriptional regulator [Burkholderia multivorans]MBU9538864.1 AraC family transcriptional regulator [Burkholderia multivorans]HEF4771965.1 helix-turn-helix transcriptional regulator [Burkholderia multivorans]